MVLRDAILGGMHVGVIAIPVSMNVSAVDGVTSGIEDIHHTTMHHLDGSATTTLLIPMGLPSIIRIARRITMCGPTRGNDRGTSASIGERETDRGMK